MKNYASMLFAAMLCLLVVACNKDKPEPDNSPCPEDYALVVAGTYTIGSATYQPAGSQLATAFDDQTITVKRVDCNLVSIITAPGTFEANCAKSSAAPTKIGGADTSLKNTYTYNTTNNSIEVTYTATNGDIYSFKVTK